MVASGVFRCFTTVASRSTSSPPKQSRPRVELMLAALSGAHVHPSPSGFPQPPPLAVRMTISSPDAIVEAAGEGEVLALAVAADQRILGPDVILGHAIIVGGSTWANYHADDVGILGYLGPLRHERRRCGVVVRAARHRHGELRALPRARGHYDACHRYVSAEHDRGCCAGPRLCQKSSTGARRSRPPPTCSMLRRLAAPRRWDGECLFMAPVRDPIRNIVYSA